MNKLLLIGLVCLPLSAQAVDDYLKSSTNLVIPHAAVARAEAKAIMKIKIANEVPLLTKVVIEEIKTTADEGYTFCNPVVNKYQLETIHIVAMKLRAKGYKVELVSAILGDGPLLAIDWSK